MTQRLCLLACLAAAGACAHGPADGAGGRHGMTHDFSDAEKWSERFDAPERAAWQRPEHVIELMEIAPGSTAVDLGAGTGYFLGRLSRAVGAEGRVIALDVAPSLVAFMRERIERERLANAQARAIPPDDPEIEAGAADRVLIVNTWHHIPDRAAYAKRLRAGLRPGGRVYVVDFTLASPRGPSRDHKIPPERVVEELAAGGLAASVVEHERLPDQYVVVGVREP